MPNAAHADYPWLYQFTGLAALSSLRILYMLLNEDGALEGLVYINMKWRLMHALQHVSRVYQLSSMVQLPCWFGAFGSIACWFNTFAVHGTTIVCLQLSTFIERLFPDVCIALTFGNIHEQLTVTPFVNRFTIDQ